jgi:hypothetical protein
MDSGNFPKIAYHGMALSLTVAVDQSHAVSEAARNGISSSLKLSQSGAESYSFLNTAGLQVPGV